MLHGISLLCDKNIIQHPQKKSKGPKENRGILLAIRRAV
jgi:hypothetical protein